MAPKVIEYETYCSSKDLIKAHFAKIEESVDKITSGASSLTYQCKLGN